MVGSIMRKIFEFFVVPGWARGIINKYRELFGDENVIYTVLDRRHVIISFRKNGKWYRAYCQEYGLAVFCFDENLGKILEHKVNWYA